MKVATRPRHMEALSAEATGHLHGSDDGRFLRAHSVVSRCGKSARA